MRREKGITLIALIITIVVLVILAAVSVREITNMGIIGKATNGVSEYEQAAMEENRMLDETANFLDREFAKLNRKRNGAGITLNKTSLTLEPAETEQLTATLKNIQGTVIWTSNNPSVATIANDGTVTAVAVGNATITAKVTCDGKEYTANCTVTVQ